MPEKKKTLSELLGEEFETSNQKASKNEQNKRSVSYKEENTPLIINYNGVKKIGNPAVKPGFYNSLTNAVNKIEERNENVI